MSHSACLKDLTGFGDSAQKGPHWQQRELAFADPIFQVL